MKILPNNKWIKILKHKVYNNIYVDYKHDGIIYTIVYDENGKFIRFSHYNKYYTKDIPPLHVRV